MAKPLRFNADVVSDLQKGIDWYERISLPLGNRFRAAVRAEFREIAAQPERFGFAFDDVRFVRLARFPYVVLFCEANQVVMVPGVLHATEDLADWAEASVQLTPEIMGEGNWDEQ